MVRDLNHLKACVCGRDRSRGICAGLRRARCDRERGAAPSPDLAAQVPLITDTVIAAARASGAIVMIPGNVYNYGRCMPPVLTEDTPWRAETRKGKIRIRIDNGYRDSDERTIVLRSGDLLEAAKTGNWFDSHIAV